MGHSPSFGAPEMLSLIPFALLHLSGCFWRFPLGRSGLNLDGLSLEQGHSLKVPSLYFSIPCSSFVLMLLSHKKTRTISPGDAVTQSVNPVSAGVGVASLQ